ncbi:MAG: hypothetical protein NVSMB26_01630 [Beijerinckiaceae bacterium]
MGENRFINDIARAEHDNDHIGICNRMPHALGSANTCRRKRLHFHCIPVPRRHGEPRLSKPPSHVAAHDPGAQKADPRLRRHG